MEKAVIGGKVAIALGIMCIVLFASLGIIVASYTMMTNNKDETNQNYVSTHSHDNTEFNSLDAQYDAYVASHQHTNLEFDSAVTAPKLATVDVTVEDDWSRGPYVSSSFRVSGIVVNAGSDAAYNPKIHVVAYKLIDVKAIDAYYSLATIDGESWMTFDTTFVYSGGPIYSWTVTPQWTTTP